MDTLFPLPVVAEQSTPQVPPEARGKVGAMATAYGVGTKDEGLTTGTERFFALDDSQLIPMPTTAHPSWGAEDIETVFQLSERAAAAGQFRHGNLFRQNLTKPKSCYFKPDALSRMVEGMERTAAGKARELGPVAPEVIYADFADFARRYLAGASYSPSIVPTEIGAAVVAAVNERLHKLAAAGFASRQGVNYGNAPADIVAASSQISAISGATMRVVNQIGHLSTVSRIGQTAHAPMTFARRLMLVDSALAQLAEDIGCGAWTAAEAGILTAEVRQAWQARDQADPLPTAHPRNLFDWAWPAPHNLTDAALDKAIQSHPDIEYVEALRAERKRRNPAFVSRV